MSHYDDVITEDFISSELKLCSSAYSAKRTVWDTCTVQQKSVLSDFWHTLDGSASYYDVIVSVHNNSPAWKKFCGERKAVSCKDCCVDSPLKDFGGDRCPHCGSLRVVEIGWCFIGPEYI